MGDLNKWIGVGRVSRGAERKVLPGGMSLTTFSIATNESYKKDGAWQERANFLKCIIWGKYGETMQKHLVKGKQIGIAAHLQQQSWRDSNNQYCERVQLVIEDIQLLASPKGTPQGGQSAPADQESAPEYSGSEDDYPSPPEDEPFN
jgi:single-strand DNA-binding protein